MASRQFRSIHQQKHSPSPAFLCKVVCVVPTIFGTFFILRAVMSAFSVGGATDLLPQSSTSSIAAGAAAIATVWIGISFLLSFAGAAVERRKRPDPHTRRYAPADEDDDDEAVSHSLLNNKKKEPEKGARGAQSLPVVVVRVVRALESIFFGVIVPIAFGSLPFVTIYVDLEVFKNAMWTESITFTAFGFLTISFLVWIAVTGTAAVHDLYTFRLREANRHWWWFSFLAPCSGVLMIGADAVVYLVDEVNQGRQPQPSSSARVVLYLIYLFLYAFLYGLASGAVGFMACQWFVKKLYVEKVD